MSSKWSKEDRKVWESSEVMMELEKQVASNIDFVKKFADADAQREALEALNNELSETARVAPAAGNAMSAAFTADDHVIGEDSEDSDESDAEGSELDPREAVLGELRAMIKLAVDEGNEVLAYRIERTIEEILDI